MPTSTGSATPALAGGKAARLTLNVENQNLESINKIVANILGRSGCRACGRLLNLDFTFQVDPGPDYSGVVSVETEGF